jgi:hypothetical protein
MNQTSIYNQTCPCGHPIKQSPALKGHICVDFSQKISYKLNLLYRVTCLIRPLFLCPKGDLLIHVWLYIIIILFQYSMVTRPLFLAGYYNVLEVSDIHYVTNDYYQECIFRIIYQLCVLIMFSDNPYLTPFSGTDFCIVIS